MTTKKIKYRNINKKKRQKLKRFTAGVLSPYAASKKIQSVVRGKLDRAMLKEIDFRKKDLYGETFSGKNLNYARFDGADLRWSKMNKCLLNHVIAKGANFSNAQLKETIANNANFTDAIFTESNLSGFSSTLSTFDNCKFNYENRVHSINDAFGQHICILKLASFFSCSFKKCLFGDINITSSIFSKCDFSNSKFISSPIYLYSIKFNECCMDNVILQDYANLFAFIKNPVALNGAINTINNLTIINLSDNPISRQERSGRKAVITTKFNYLDTTFNDLHIENLFLKECGKFMNCTFNKLKLGNTDETRVQFYKILFTKCSFNNCNFGSFISHSCKYIECVFTNCNINKSDLRSCVFSDSTFSNCNLDGIKFVGSNFYNAKFTNNTILSNIDFQECDDMDRMNFQGLNLQGSRLVGITDPGLEGCNFRDANLRGVQFDFSQVHGSDFTGADLTGCNVRAAEGSNETVGIPDDHEEGRTVDTHKTFYNIRVNALVDFYKSKTGKTDRDIPSDDREFSSSIQSILMYMIDKIDDSSEKKRHLREGLIKCFIDRLNSYDFSKIVAGSEPKIDFKTLIYFAMQYLTIQPDEFQALYIEAFIIDSTETYGPGGMSCAAGIVERMVTVMEQPASVVKDSVASKLEEYIELMNIITNNTKALIKQYQQEWFEYHREGGPHSFAKSVALDTIMADYKDFLEKKFDYANLRGAEKEQIRLAIQDNPDAGTKITREYIESSVLFFGGRVKDNRHLNYFKMLKDRFYIKKSVRQSHTRKKKRPRIRHRTRVHRSRK